MSNIGERVKTVIASHFGVEPSKVIDEARFVDDLGGDSYDTFELVMALEEEFGCVIPPEVSETILTVRDAITFVEQNAPSS